MDEEGVSDDGFGKRCAGHTEFHRIGNYFKKIPQI
jgi:hypothetical protein